MKAAKASCAILTHSLFGSNIGGTILRHCRGVTFVLTQVGTLDMRMQHFLPQSSTPDHQLCATHAFVTLPSAPVCAGAACGHRHGTCHQAPEGEQHTQANVCRRAGQQRQAADEVSMQQQDDSGCRFVWCMAEYSGLDGHCATRLHAPCALKFLHLTLPWSCNIALTDHPLLLSKDAVCANLCWL